jgi:hypothetical protein
MVQTELAEKQKELETTEKNIDKPNKLFNQKIKLMDEIEQNLDITNGEFKTKKIEDSDTEKD